MTLGARRVWRSHSQVCIRTTFSGQADRTRLIPEFLAAQAMGTTGKAFTCQTDYESASINATQLRLFPLNSPLAEQRKIAEIRGRDEAIALVERRLAAARARKQGLMQRLLTGQVRFPGSPSRGARWLGEVAEVNPVCEECHGDAVYLRSMADVAEEGGITYR